MFLLAQSPQAFSQRELIDRIVAEVNSYPILYSEVAAKVKDGPLVTISEYPATEQDPPFVRAREDAINYRLVMNDVRKLEIEVSDDQVEEQIKQILRQNNISMDNLRGFLMQQGKSFDEYRQDIRDQMLVMRWRGRALFPRVKYTEKDVEAYWQKKSGAKNDALALALRQIFIKVPDGSSSDIRNQRKGLAEEALKKLEASANNVGREKTVEADKFIELEKVYSDLDDARKNEPAKSFKVADLNATIRTAVEHLNPKQISPIVTTQQGFFIFYLEKKDFAESREFLAHKAEIEQELRQVELLEQLRRWLKEERARAKVNVINT